MGQEPSADPVADLITTYNELNSTIVDELDQEPSPLEFMRYVARNTPFVVRGAATSWKAVQRWDRDFLTETLGDQAINVAVTPHGNADAPTALPDGTFTLSKPHEEDQSFSSFLSTIIAQTKADLASDKSTSRPPHHHHQARHEQESLNRSSEDVLYAQTQNDNLRNEYSALFSLSHLPSSIPFARIALGQDAPDALNLWIGNARAVTALHRDNYENLYVQVRGRKRFVLLPPLCQPCVAERPLKAATYRRRRRREPEEAQDESRGGGDRLEPQDSHDYLRLELDHDADDVPFATWDPDFPEESATPYSHLAKPMTLVLEPGDMLYLPAMWYHKVSQFCIPDDEGFVLAVNYWYDMDFSGPLYPMTSFVRDIGLQSQQKPQDAA